MSKRTELEEMTLWAETVRLHYLSLEGMGERYQEEAEFFLLWHWDCCAGLDELLGLVKKPMVTGWTRAGRGGVRS